MICTIISRTQFVFTIIQQVILVQTKQCIQKKCLRLFASWMVIQRKCNDTRIRVLYIIIRVYARQDVASRITFVRLKSTDYDATGYIHSYEYFYLFTVRRHKLCSQSNLRRAQHTVTSSKEVSVRYFSLATYS